MTEDSELESSKSLATSCTHRHTKFRLLGYIVCKSKTLPANIGSNTAQILSSIAEAQESDSSIQPLSLLDESLILFDKCLAIQEQQIEQYKSDTAFFAGPEGDRFRAEADAKAEAETASLDPTPTTSSGPQGEKDERWVFILEPATNDTLLDTILAKLETLTLFTSLLPPSPPAPVWANIHNSASSILSTRITTYTANTSPERKLEATLLHASYNCAFAEAQFKSSLISPSMYFDQVCSNYQFLSSPKPDDRSLCDSADSYIAFNDAVRISMKKGGGGEYELVMRWKALSQALTNLTSVSEKPVVDTDRLVVIHLSRGDVEILRWQLGQAGLAVAKQYGTVLLGNAEKFYRGALRFSTGMGAMQEKADEAKLKEAYAKALQGDGQQEEFKELLGSREKYIIEMAQEGLLEDEQLKYFGIEVQD